MLTLLESGKVNLIRSNITLDTSGMLIICAGVFGDLSRRTSHPSDPPTTEELQQFGFIPELIGRFTTISRLDPLTSEDFFRILTTKQSSIFEPKKQFFALHGIELTVTEPALRAVADRAYRLNLGVRGISRILNQILSDIEYTLPDLMEAGVNQVIVNEYTIREGTAVYQYNPERAVNDEAQAIVFELRQTFTSRQDSTAAAGISLPQTLDVAKQQIGWPETTGSAKKWWDAFEQENSHRPGLILRLAQELIIRQATISEFFLAYVYSNADSIQANLHYLDYTRLKKAEKKKKEE